MQFNFSYKKVKKINIKQNGIQIVEDENKIDYSFSDFNENNFPKEFTLKIKSKESFEATLNYSKIEFNSQQIFPFKIPDSYVEIK